MKTGRRVNLVLLCGVLLCTAIVLRASGPAGCYAIVEKVVMEPNESAPQRIQVWGLFSLAEDKEGRGYRPPQKGVLYFALPPDKAQQPATLAEWSDLKKLAGTGSVITFAERYSWSGRIRKATDKLESPDPYPRFNGITRVATGNGLGSIDNPAVIAQLKAAIKATN